MIYVYAITEISNLPPPTDTVPLEIIEENGLAALCTRRPPSSPEPTAEEVWRHELVIETLMRDRTALPVRFGTTFPDEQPLRDVLRRNRRALSEALERVRGCVELGVRVIWQSAAAEELPSSVNTAFDSGRAYMLARLAREQRLQQARAVAEHAAASVHQALAPLARDTRLRTTTASPGTQHHVLAAAYLVECSTTAEFAAEFTHRTAHLAHALPDVKLLCTGPWPPYHFVPQLHQEDPLDG